MKRTVTLRIFAAIITLAALNATSTLATTWHTIAAGDITTLTNWSDGSASPTTFATPGDSWAVNHLMTISSFSSWTLGTASAAPVNLTINGTGKLECTGSSSGVGLINVYGNVDNMGGVIRWSGSGTSALVLHIYGNYTMPGGYADAAGSGSGYLSLNVHGNLTMSGGSLRRSGTGSSIDSVNVWGAYTMTGGRVLGTGTGSGNVAITANGDFRVTGPAAMVYTVDGPGNTVHLTGFGTLVSNTSTGTWSGTKIWIDALASTTLADNFSVATGGTGYGLTVNGALKCPAPFAIYGNGDFILNTGGSLAVNAPTGINGTLFNTGAISLSRGANYEYFGTYGQVTGSLLPDTLVAPGSLIVNTTGKLELSHSVTTTGTVMFLSGFISTRTCVLTVPASPAAMPGSGIFGFVSGNLTKVINGERDVIFDVGYYNWTGFDISFDSTPVPCSIATHVSDFFAVLPPYFSNSGIDDGHIAKEMWTIETRGDAGHVKVTPRFHYFIRNTTAGSNLDFGIQRYSGTSWLPAAIAGTNMIAPMVYYGDIGTTVSTAGIPWSNFSGDYIAGVPKQGYTNSVKPEPGEISKLEINPNPSDGRFVVVLHASGNEEAQAVVTDVPGRVVKRFSIKPDTPREIMLDAPAGTYMLSVQSKASQLTEKIVIQ